MAQQVTTIYECDMDGQRGAETVQLPDGREIDLCPQHKAALEGFLKPYMDASRRSSQPQAVRPKKQHIGPSTETVRAWALANGYSVANRGRIQRTVVEDFIKANP